MNIMKINKLVSFIVISVAAAVCSAPALADQPDAPTGNACGLLTEAQVSRVLGVKVKPAKSDPQVPTICTWHQAGGSSLGGRTLLLTLTTPDSFESGKTPMSRIIKTPVSGIGDSAYFTEYASHSFVPTLSVRKGKLCFVLTINGPGIPYAKTKAELKQIAHAVVSKP